jgi:hypothetical protein
VGGREWRAMMLAGQVTSRWLSHRLSRRKENSEGDSDESSAPASWSLARNPSIVPGASCAVVLALVVMRLVCSLFRYRD